MSYHNTQGLEDVREYERKALSQDERIMEYFRTMEFGSMAAPSEINKWVLPNAPITSVRRSITNLTKAGLLIKTNNFVKGPYSRPEGLWEMADPVQEKLF